MSRISIGTFHRRSARRRGLHGVVGLSAGPVAKNEGIDYRYLHRISREDLNMELINWFLIVSNHISVYVHS